MITCICVYMYICPYIVYIYVCMYTSKRTDPIGEHTWVLYTCLYVYMRLAWVLYTCLYVYIWDIYMFVCIYETYTCFYVYIHETYTCLYVYMSIILHVCMYMRDLPTHFPSIARALPRTCMGTSCQYMYIYMYACTHMHACMHLYIYNIVMSICIHTHVHIYAHTRIDIHVTMYTHINATMYIRINARTFRAFRESGLVGQSDTFYLSTCALYL